MKINIDKPSILGEPLFVHNPPLVNAGETWGNFAASNFRLLSRGGSRSEASGFSMDFFGKSEVSIQMAL
jgi:hypothetical protein